MRFFEDCRLDYRPARAQALGMPLPVHFNGNPAQYYGYAGKGTKEELVIKIGNLTAFIKQLMLFDGTRDPQNPITTIRVKVVNVVMTADIMGNFIKLKL